MYIETKAYKFNATKKEVHDRMTRLGEDSKLKGYWIDENNFRLQKKYSFFFKLEGNITELESHHKMIISITSCRKYLLLFLIPLALIIDGIIQWSVNSTDTENGWILFLGGISLAIFIYLVASAMIGNLKNCFKVEFQLV